MTIVNHVQVGLDTLDYSHPLHTVTVIRYDDGTYKLRFGIHTFEFDCAFTHKQWVGLIDMMAETAAAIDPDEEIRYYGDSELDPNPPEED